MTATELEEYISAFDVLYNQIKGRPVTIRSKVYYHRRVEWKELTWDESKDYSSSSASYSNYNYNNDNGDYYSNDYIPPAAGNQL